VPVFAPTPDVWLRSSWTVKFYCPVLEQAKDEDARRFYMACAEFIECPEDSRTLFLPVETLIAAYG
jgi:hypothetical protein